MKNISLFSIALVVSVLIGCSPPADRTLEARFLAAVGAQPSDSDVVLFVKYQRDLGGPRQPQVSDRLTSDEVENCKAKAVWVLWNGVLACNRFGGSYCSSERAVLVYRMCLEQAAAD